MVDTNWVFVATYPDSGGTEIEVPRCKVVMKRPTRRRYGIKRNFER